ncbi:hypothetical protein OH146_03000 [Salinibacterium sp. SYSU T00001]|uniref:hypothetical protein n=1 Tax=Homoserinimonas sedimenticola TaxID=2986805 RepID=UPI0022361438|nr:hypothetical protein [Salinibacterium sedimenticola]MCW4384737.1 hypothetical protein [Salinibacterium sedimenticola]
MLALAPVARATSVRSHDVDHGVDVRHGRTSELWGRDLALVPLRGGLWRVTRPDGDVLGYVEKFERGDGTRYRAKRISPTLRRFVLVGEFWRMEDAVACFLGG